MIVVLQSFSCLLVCVLRINIMLETAWFESVKPVVKITNGPSTGCQKLPSESTHGPHSCCPRLCNLECMFVVRWAVALSLPLLSYSLAKSDEKSTAAYNTKN